MFTFIFRNGKCLTCFSIPVSEDIWPVREYMNQKKSFFTKDPTFYKNVFSMLAFVALQNIVAYSVNMADNIMLGMYSQTALSGAAIVNQIFIIQQFAFRLQTL